MPRNVVLVTVDSLRADRLSCMGYGRMTTPSIDALAADGMLYRRAFSHGSDTGNSFVTLLTGVYPGTADVWLDEPPYNPPLPAHFPYLPAAFAERGYHTAGFHCNPLISSRFGYDRGFATYFDSLDVGEAHRRRPLHKRLNMRLRFGHPRIYRGLMAVRDLVLPQRVARVPAGEINRRVEAFLDGAPEPFFLFVHYMDVHVPYLPSPELLRELTGRRISRRRMTRLNRAVFEWRADLVRDVGDIIAMYDAQLRAFDDHLGAFVGALRKRGLYEDSVIALTADHGEQFMEHGSLKHDTGIFYDELLHVPLILKSGPLGTSDDLVGQVDLAPTLLALAGLEPPAEMAGRPIDGSRAAIIAESRARGERRVAVRTMNRKFIWNMATGRTELYDLDADPAEAKDISEERRDGVEAFRAIAREHVEAVGRKAIELKARGIGRGGVARPGPGPRR